MDIRGKDAYGTKQPRGPATTLIDLVTRDDQDSAFFPSNAKVSRFTRNEGVRTVPLSTVFREFTFKGPADFGQTFIFDLNNTMCGDLLQRLFIQVRVGDWLTRLERERLETGIYSFQNNTTAWTYINSLGTALLNEATLEVDDQILEKITGDTCSVVTTLFPDLNTQVGLSDTTGRVTLPQVKAWTGASILPTDDDWITIPLCFSFFRERLTATFPLTACRDGTVRVRISLKRFDQVVRSVSGKKAQDDTPMGKDVGLYDLRFANYGPIILNTSTPVNPPRLRSIQLLTHGIFVDGPYREMLLRQPFERPFREIQQFDFTEPLKYVVNKNGGDTITVQLPLEANQPIEEIVWFLRRKSAIRQNNDWVNFSATLESDYDPVFSPLEPLLISAKLQGNGMDIISQDEKWFRSHISRAHKGGRVSYESFIYGYSFADHPAEHNPTGSINASRLSSLRLSLEVRPPTITSPADSSVDTEWEVHVFVFAFQWLRFENGICNKLFID
jgi:hypothetical protein